MKCSDSILAYCVLDAKNNEGVYKKLKSNLVKLMSKVKPNVSKMDTQKSQNYL